MFAATRQRSDRLRVDGKEGVAGSSPAEGFRNRATARFSCFRCGSADPFRTVPSEKGSSMAAGWLSAVAGGIAEHIPLVAKVPTRYTMGARTVAAIRETVGDAFDVAQLGLSRRAG